MKPMRNSMMPTTPASRPMIRSQFGLNTIESLLVTPNVTRFV
jgi:hypothetical protein